MKHLLIVEDDTLTRNELATLLSNAGYSITCVTDFSHTLDRIREASPDLILLDINLPGQNGYSLCAAIRQTSDVPILFLTGRSASMDELQGLMLGGDDYISKPYNIPILLARINTLLKRLRPDIQADYIEYKGLRLCPAAGTISCGGRKVDLSRTELKILYYLFRHPGEIVPRADLVNYLWDSDIHIDDNTLSVNVMRIRDKLHTLGISDLIATRRGMGYRI